MKGCEAMTQPVYYLQTDKKWASIDYSAKGESTTIGASGCGPTAMAMVLATWADSSVTPKTECAWALANGYKAPHSGTYYGYFVPAGKRYGLTVKQLNSANIYGNSTSAYHAQAKAAIDRGCLVIACMGKGNWTSSGHYVVVWDIKGDTIYINDSASTKTSRTRGSYNLFKQQVKYYWTIEPPTKKTTTTKIEEDEDMDIDKLLTEMTDEQAYKLMAKAQSYAGKIMEPEWSTKEGHFATAEKDGVMDGTRPEAFVKRDELAAVLDQMEGQRMTRRQREVFRLVYREGIGIIPAAVELEVSRGTVNNELRKIREGFL
jgi:hypothetical protein